jgi:hypothetical protein
MTAKAQELRRDCREQGERSGHSRG